MDNEKNCDKYEALFVFKSESDFNEHLKNCPDCQKEHEKYLKISSLVKEVAPEYLKRQEKRKLSAIKRLACCFVAFIGISTFAGYTIYTDNNFQVNSADESYIESTMGLPCDDYGLLEI